MKNTWEAIGLLAQIIGYAGLAGIAIYALIHSFRRAQTANWKEVAEARNARIQDLASELNTARLHIESLKEEIERKDRLIDRLTKPHQQ